MYPLKLFNYQKSNLLDLRNRNTSVTSLSFHGRAIKKPLKLPVIKQHTPSNLNPGNLPDISYDLRAFIIKAANKMGKTVDEYLRDCVPGFKNSTVGVSAEPSVSSMVGNTKVTTLIDGEQIFDKVVGFIKNAKQSIQVEMFEFQNIKKKIDGDIWPSKGAETIPGWDQQQRILELLVEKKKAHPEVNIQVILDAHKWYQDGNGMYKRHYGNVPMIKYLKENNIDVVPYPRANQGGTTLQHVKMLAVDSKKVILGGMNWGNHSVVNHDACIAIETKRNCVNSEVDNIISDVFDKDWAFAWQRFANTKFMNGPLSPEEQNQYKGRKKKILQESVEYVKELGALFNKAEYKERYAKGELNLPKTNPINTPKIQVFTNSPREYSQINSSGSEGIGNYLKEKLDNATSLRAELFVLSHKEIVNKIIGRVNEAKSGGRPFDVQVLISPGILDDFPYCRTAFEMLQEADVPIRMYKVNNELEQRLHSKWAVLDKKELVIGSANWSAAGLENNIKTGLRPDYKQTNKLIDAEIAEHKPRINELEKQLGLSNLFDKNDKIDYQKLKNRRKEIKHKLAEITKLDIESAPLSMEIDGSKIDVNTANINKIKKLLGDYKLVKTFEDRRNTYKRGNHECAVLIQDKKISNTFLRQFDKDWEYSNPQIPEGYGVKKDVSFTGQLRTKFLKSVEPKFDSIV